MIEANPFFNRYSPSPEYTRLLNEYKDMHKAAKGMFNGRSLVKFIDIIKHYLEKNNCKTLLDYGCGKGHLYTDDYEKVIKDEKLNEPLPQYWKLNSHRLYDPAYEEHDELPTGKYDAVISTDVLEHIPTSDMRWVVQEIFRYSKKIAFLNIACMPALKKLKDGSNAHISLHSPHSWCQFLAEISEDYPDLIIYVFFDEIREDGLFETGGYKIVRRPNIIPLTIQD
jgi:hypothetical protein